METNFFKDCGNVNIGGGQFIVNNGPNNSRKTINNQRTTTINDNSRHTTSYGSYNNYGQHAEGGQINNYAPQTTNHGPIYGYKQYAGSNGPKVSDPGFDDLTPSDDGYDFAGHLPASGQNPRYRQPDRVNTGERDYYGRYPAATQSDTRLGNTRTQGAGLPRRAQTGLPNKSKTEPFGPSNPAFREEYAKMSPTLKKHLQSLGVNVDGPDSLNERMANVSLDDPVLQRSRSPGNLGRPTPDAAQKRNYVHRSPSFDSDEGEGEGEEEEEEEEADHNSRQYSSYVHNDNRVVTTNINSNNTNTENVVDSYNDNSTRTDIKKTSARGN